MKYIFTAFLWVITLNLFAQFTLVRDFNSLADGSFTSTYGGGVKAKLGAKVLVEYDTITNPGPQNFTRLSAVSIDGNREIITTAPWRDQEYGPTFFDFRELPNNKIAFVVNYDDSDWKIVLTDGTEEGTEELYYSSVTIIGMELIANGLYFTHKTTTGSNYELVKIDLTDKSVSVVKEFGDAYYISDISKTDENTLIFYASDPDDLNKLKLFKSDGTAAGTTALKLLYSGGLLSQQTVMTKVGSKVFFFIKQPGSDCCNYLWVTDGTAGGTVKLNEFNMVDFVDYQSTKSALAWNDKFYFMGVESAGNTNNERVLWVSDGTIAGTLALHDPLDYYRSKQFTVFNNKLYFVAYDQNSFNNRLYRTDGTVTGTEMVNVKYNTSSIAPYELVTNGTYLYMAGYCIGQGEELFRYDGANLECAMAEGATGAATYTPDRLFVNGNDLYFTADVDISGRELYTATNFLTYGTTGVTKEIASTISIYPNPAQSKVEVQTTKPLSQLVLLNSQGKEVASSTTNLLNLENQPAGVYTMKVIFEDQSTAFSKVVVAE